MSSLEFVSFIQKPDEYAAQIDALHKMGGRLK